MSHSRDNSGPRRRGAIPLSELVGRLVAPLTATRSFAKSDLSAAWNEIVGDRFAAFSRPEKLVWPKGPGTDGLPALLVIRVHGPRAIYLQHEAGQIVERVNAFLGYRAVGQIRITQGSVESEEKRAKREAPTVSPEVENKLVSSLESVENEKLRAALERLGRGVLANTTGKKTVATK